MGDDSSGQSQVKDQSGFRRMPKSNEHGDKRVVSEKIFSKLDVNQDGILDEKELSVAKEMIRAGIESVSGSVSDFDEFFDSQKERLSKKPVILH